MSVINKRGILFSDGEKLAVGFSDYDRMYLLEGYHLASVSFYTDTVDVNLLGSLISTSIVTSQHVEFTVSSSGNVNFIPFNKGVKLFKSAGDMSINELLAIAFQKMDSRH